MKIAIGSDHAGFEMRRTVIEYLRGSGHEVLDFGTNSTESTDYPIYGARVGRAVAAGEAERGIAICGSGVGISIAANKISGVRCVCCSEPYSALLSRRHNDCNVLAFGARIVGPDMALAIVDAWLDGEYEAGRHSRRVNELARLDVGEDLDAEAGC